MKYINKSKALYRQKKNDIYLMITIRITWNKKPLYRENNLCVPTQSLCLWNVFTIAWELTPFLASPPSSMYRRKPSHNQRLWAVQVNNEALSSLLPSEDQLPSLFLKTIHTTHQCPELFPSSYLIHPLWA